LNQREKISKSEREKRLNKLNELKSGNIYIEDVAVVFDISIKTARGYKDRGLIVSTDKDGTRDLFDIVDIRNRKHRIQQLRRDNTLRQIRKILDSELENINE
jgi:DNA-binding transcriptional MerR regulator